MVTFNPSKQTDYCTYIERCYNGDAPTLKRVEITYGKKVAITWLELQLRDFEEFTNIEDKLSIEKRTELAKVILCSYYYLKVTEVMLFFVRLKSGRYGKLYNHIDTIFITTSIRAFLSERNNEMDNYIQKQKERRKTKANGEKQGLLTYEEYKAKLNQNNNGENNKR